MKKVGDDMVEMDWLELLVWELQMAVLRAATLIVDGVIGGETYWIDLTD